MPNVRYNTCPMLGINVVRKEDLTNIEPDPSNSLGVVSELWLAITVDLLSPPLPRGSLTAPHNALND